MSLLTNANFLGIAVGERVLSVAEIGASRASRGRWEVRRIAEFPIGGADAGTGGAKGEGDALRRFLRQHRFSASRVVIGVPARWLVAREKELPPTTAPQAADVLRLQAERLFSSELKDLVFDYAGTPDPAEPRKILLMALPRRQLDRVVQLAEAAGLSVEAVMPSTIALGAAGCEGVSDGLLLSVTPDAVELSARAAGAPRLLRHLPVRSIELASQNGTRAVAVSALASEVKRAVALIPAATPDRQSPRRVVFWDGVGLESEDSAALAEHAGVELEAQDGVSAMGMSAPGAGSALAPAELSRHAPAVALALMGARTAAKRQSPPVDFLHSRLAPAKRQRIGRRALWGGILAVTLAIAFGALGLDLRQRSEELDDLQAHLKMMEPDIKVAEAVAERVGLARGWFEARPPMLECLREVTLAFRENEQIYVTSFSLWQNRKGQLAGKSSEQKTVLALIDRLLDNGKFADVKLLHMQDAVGSSREVSFSLSFTFTGVE